VSRYADSDARTAAMFDLDPGTYTAAVTAAWSALNPQSVPRRKAEAAALAVLLAVRKTEQKEAV
jgi:hypothetical protein